MTPPSNRHGGSGRLTSSSTSIAELKTHTVILSNTSDISEIEDLKDRAIIGIGGFVLFILISLGLLFSSFSRVSIKSLRKALHRRFTYIVRNLGDETLMELAMENANHWLEQILHAADGYSDEKVVRLIIRKTLLKWLSKYRKEIMHGYISVARYLITIHEMDKTAKRLKSLLSAVKPVDRHQVLNMYWWTKTKKDVAGSLSTVGIVVAYGNKVIVPTWFWELDPSVSGGREMIRIGRILGNWLRDLECKDKWKSCLVTAVGEYVSGHMDSALQRVLICFDTALDKVASILGAFKENGTKDGKKSIDYGKIAEELRRIADVDVHPHELEKMHKMRNYVAHTPTLGVDFVEANSIFYRSLRIMVGLCKILISKEA
ncbi:hypothetical protein ODS41_12210 [Pyrobaculum sp. 3827-6]|uniref:hypothetical protein n=1 Tax=Pyrobaculum sp. 3827-6 TaxID=2983604 RepID=UPI0021DAB783|nr:hypothetical protein [Pyrobaculum sp. 3827-6]MCU7788677.1 hypothetical protein [Pyrobaculum sp. 3827-6]